MAATWLTCSRCRRVFQVEQGNDPCCPTCGSAGNASLPAKPEETRWYCALDRKKVGPLSWLELRTLCAQGKLKAADMVLQDGTQKWRAVSSIAGLLQGKDPRDERAEAMKAWAEATAPTHDQAGETQPPGATQSAEPFKPSAPAALPPGPVGSPASPDKPLIALQAQAGIWWTVRDGFYYATPALGRDAVSTLDSDHLPAELVLEVTVNANPPTTGYRSNAFAVFDYRDPTEFKYAGLRSMARQWVIGQRDARGWTDQANAGDALAPDKDFRMQLQLQGKHVLLSVHGQLKIGYQFPGPVSAGRLGLATQNSFARFDDLVVRASAPEET